MATNRRPAGGAPPTLRASPHAAMCSGLKAMVEVAVREKYLFQTFDFLHSTLRVNTPGDYATASGAGIAHVTCNAPDRAIRVHALYAMKGVKRRSPRSPLARALGPCHCRADAGRLAAARRQEEQRRKRRARASGLFIAHPTGQAALPIWSNANTHRKCANAATTFSSRCAARTAVDATADRDVPPKITPEMSAVAGWKNTADVGVATASNHLNVTCAAPLRAVEKARRDWCRYDRRNAQFDVERTIHRPHALTAQRRNDQIRVPNVPPGQRGRSRQAQAPSTPRSWFHCYLAYPAWTRAHATVALALYDH